MITTNKKFQAISLLVFEETCGFILMVMVILCRQITIPQFRVDVYSARNPKYMRRFFASTVTYSRSKAFW